MGTLQRSQCFASTAVANFRLAQVPPGGPSLPVPPARPCTVWVTMRAENGNSHPWGLEALAEQAIGHAVEAIRQSVDGHPPGDVPEEHAVSALDEGLLRLAQVYADEVACANFCMEQRAAALAREVGVFVECMAERANVEPRYLLSLVAPMQMQTQNPMQPPLPRPRSVS